jgi:hypothetical protein
VAAAELLLSRAGEQLHRRSIWRPPVLLAPDGRLEGEVTLTPEIDTLA